MLDCLGFVLKAIVEEGNASERTLAQAAIMELAETKPELLEKVELMWVDGGYSGERFALGIWLMIQAKVEVIKRQGKAFQVLPKRWIVEKTFGWFNWYRRLSKEYEQLSEVSEAMIYKEGY